MLYSWLESRVQIRFIIASAQLYMHTHTILPNPPHRILHASTLPKHIPQTPTHDINHTQPQRRPPHQPPRPKPAHKSTLPPSPRQNKISRTPRARQTRCVFLVALHVEVGGKQEDGGEEHGEGLEGAEVLGCYEGGG